MRGGIYADQRIGEILRELPTRSGKRTDLTSVPVGTEVTKRQAEQDAGISHKQSIDLQKMASNPEVVQAVLDKAEQDGTIPSRKQVLDAINAQKQDEDGPALPDPSREHMQHRSVLFQRDVDVLDHISGRHPYRP